MPTLLAAAHCHALAHAERQRDHFARTEIAVAVGDPGPEAAIEIAVGALVSSLIDTVLLAVPGLPAASVQLEVPVPLAATWIVAVVASTPAVRVNVAL